MANKKNKKNKKESVKVRDLKAKKDAKGGACASGKHITTGQL
jgi:hypothetical protein